MRVFADMSRRVPLVTQPTGNWSLVLRAGPLFCWSFHVSWCCPSQYVSVGLDIDVYKYGSSVWLRLFGESKMFGLKLADLVALLGKAMEVGLLLSIYLTFDRVDLLLFCANVFLASNQKKEADVTTSSLQHFNGPSVVCAMAVACSALPVVFLHTVDL